MTVSGRTPTKLAHIQIDSAPLSGLQLSLRAIVRPMTNPSRRPTDRDDRAHTLPALRAFAISVLVSLFALSTSPAFAQAAGRSISATVFAGPVLGPEPRFAAGYVLGYGFGGPVFLEMEITRNPSAARVAFNLVVEPRQERESRTVYGTIGFGLDSWNVGVGVKRPLAGPLKMRFDYRALVPSDLMPTRTVSHRVYVGLTIGG